MMTMMKKNESDAPSLVWAKERRKWRRTSESQREMAPSMWPAQMRRPERGEAGQRALTLIELVSSRSRLAGRSEASDWSDEWFSRPV